MNMKLTTRVSLIALVALLSACAVSTPHTSKSGGDLTKTLTDIQKSTVYLVGKDSLCSAWVLKGTHTIVTAAHCMDDGMQVDFKGNGEKMYPTRIIKRGDEERAVAPDLMTLTTDSPDAPWPAGLAVCPFKPYYGEEVYIFGSPLGVPNEILKGSVSLPHLDSGHGGLVGISGDIYPGNSGGAAVDIDSDCVVGVSELVVLATPGSGIPYGLSFLTPSAGLAELA